MKGLNLAAAMGLLALFLALGLMLAGNALSDQNPVGDLDRGFMTDRLLEEDLDRGAEPLRERNRDEASEEADENLPSDLRGLDERDTPE